MNNSQNANELINETSPYLLQHAYNPVKWMPWGKEALQKAKESNKPLLISIGYSACHWCHVMEHESFEDSSIARIMNNNFVCIKVDREERPDIDAIYMEAVQMMTGRGGWPLNCIATPEGKPFYGGTYFPKKQWEQVLTQISELYASDPKKVFDYANQLTEGIQQNNLIVPSSSGDKSFDINKLKPVFENWQSNFDQEHGGNNYAPKFPMPNQYEYLLCDAFLNDESISKSHIKLSLKKMAFGGIYDQIGGGFARYSTDSEWKVPHFEKMLYDNAQLISIYSKAYQLDPDPLYKSTVENTIEFIERELRDKSGGFYSALDADSEGIEGKYYTWEKEELKSILGEAYTITSKHYNINNLGYWEDDRYILLRNKENEELAISQGLDLNEYQRKIEEINTKLLNHRANRIRPGLDNKVITSWNALMVLAYLDAYAAFQNKSYLKQAKTTANFIVQNQLSPEGGLFRIFSEKHSKINGFLDDYSFVIEAFVRLYELSGEKDHLNHADQLAQYSIEHFKGIESAYFFYTDKKDPALVARATEIQDNVISSSNSSMCVGLYRLGTILQNQEYLKLSQELLVQAQENILNNLPAYAYWGKHYLLNTSKQYEVVIIGENAQEFSKEWFSHFLPNCVSMVSINEDQLPLSELKYQEGKTSIYVCENKVCQYPVYSVEEALKLVQP